MHNDLEKKVDRLIRLLEDQELATYHSQCGGGHKIVRELVLNTVLASAVGYFMFRILDHHFRAKQ
tara:strand:- start:172 stop:366 length:195 start_codon:yes stop_codon:yes gene_type:complete